jgi:hypothetical protein
MGTMSIQPIPEVSAGLIPVSRGSPAPHDRPRRSARGRGEELAEATARVSPLWLDVGTESPIHRRAALCLALEIAHVKEAGT